MSKHARFRWACDHRLKNAIATIADTSRHHHPRAADSYARARARGRSHQHATRILARAWGGVIWRIWHDHTTYNPARHRALQRHLTQRVDTGSLTRAPTAGRGDAGDLLVAQAGGTRHPSRSARLGEGLRSRR